MEIEIDALIWEEWDQAHISRHAVSIAEVEEACENAIDVLLGKGDRKMLFGKTNSGRYLTVILSQVNKNEYYVVTARDTSRKERKYVFEKENK